MIALLTAFLLFAYLTVLGMAVTQAIGIRLGILRSWLLAPVVGQAVTVISQS